LLRRWSSDGFLFFTNYESRKSGELLATGKAAFCIHWKSQRRHVRVVGTIAKTTAEESDDYFNSRGRGSQIGAWASAQSRPLASRAALEAEVERVEGEFLNAVTRPPHWGGFCLKPQEIEFWQDGEHRLHDRFRFLKQKNSGWDIKRLNP
jgi:pyridoxamine 5'-phosphate oxidase